MFNTTKWISIHCFAIVLVLGMIFGAANGKYRSDNDVAMIDFEMDKVCLAVDDEIQIKATISNLSDEALHVYRKARGLPGLRIFISNENGELVGERDPIHLPRVFRLDESSFTGIGPGEGLSIRMSVSLSGRSIKEEGIYQLKMQYQSPVFKSKLPESLNDSNVLVFEHGEFDAPAKVFEVSSSCKS